MLGTTRQGGCLAAAAKLVTTRYYGNKWRHIAAGKAPVTYVPHPAHARLID